MMELIENQVYLAQGEYAKVIGRSETLLGVCEAMHYALVALHIRLQTAAAYEMLGKMRGSSHALLSALEDAAPDALLSPSWSKTTAILRRRSRCGATVRFDAFVRRIRSLGETVKARRNAQRAGQNTPCCLCRTHESGKRELAALSPRGSATARSQKSFFLRGQREAICQPALLQAPHRGATAARNACQLAAPAMDSKED